MLIYISYVLTASITPSMIVSSDTPIIDRYIWIRYDQDNDEKYLTLLSDGSVVLSINGKYKINAPTEPSASIRQVVQKFIITLDDFMICGNGYNNRPAACEKVWVKKNMWEFIDTKYGTLIVNDGMCITKGVPLYEDGEPAGETDLHMLPCDYGVDQMFTVVLTQDRNWQTFFRIPDEFHIVSTRMGCLVDHEVGIGQPFPGTNRIVYLYNTVPIIYLSLNVDLILVAMAETTIPVNENYGGQVSVVPATEETNGYYLIFGNKKLCGNGPNSSVFACLYELIYPRDAIWYIKKVAHGFSIHRGNMCITKIDDIFAYRSKEEWSVQLRRCSQSNTNQIFNFDHVDNFYI